MSTSRQVSRRMFLGSAIATAGVVVLTDTPSAAAAERGGAWSGATSANGWPVLDTAPVFRIEGSTQSVRVAGGDVATVLLHIARRVNYEIDTLRSGDVAGFRAHRHIAQPYESNYLSGTAIVIRPACYPAGAHGLLYPRELTVVRDVLAELRGVVTWGGDEQVPKESHFQIAVAPGDARLAAVARQIKGWNDGPGGQGAGATDAFDPARMRAARRFAAAHR